LDSVISLTHNLNMACNDNTLEYAHVASSAPQVSLHDSYTLDFLSYGDELCVSMLPIEHDPDFADVGAHLELGEESDSVVSSNDDDDDDDDIYSSSSHVVVTSISAIFSGFAPQSLPDDARLINQSRLQPADEALLSLIIENHLPQEMYNKILDWAHYARLSKFDIPKAIDYCTALHRMHAKYVNVCGGPPQSEIVRVPGYQPMHVYHFDFLQQAQRLYLDKDLMNHSLWHYDPKVSATGERLYSEMNTGDFWKVGVDYISQRALLPATDKSLAHHFCPVILFIDSTLADRIG
jgi:hypothetical protein